MIAEGAALVERALRSRRFGPYALQAAIAAVHAEAPTAALVYKRREHVINLLIAEGGGAPASQTQQMQGFNLISWTARGLSYWAVSDLQSAELESFVRLFRSSQTDK